MVLINEWLPNPPGVDGKNEFVELYSNSATPVNLRGWILKTESGKRSTLSGIIGPKQYLVLKKNETKLTLKNTDGSLSLYEPNGTLADKSVFLGSAPSGQSFSRINDATDISQHFVFTTPTPGLPNKINLNNSIAANSYPTDVPLNQPPPGIFEVSAMTLALAVVLTGIIFYAVTQDENLSKPLFGRDEEIW